MVLQKLLFTFFLWSVITPATIFSQPFQDTLTINKLGEYDICKHLYIYEADRSLNPGAIKDSVPAQKFIPLYPDKSFNNTTSLTPYYWLVSTIKNNLPNDETFYYWLNSPGLDTVIAYRRTSTDNFKKIGISGYSIPILERQEKGHDVEFGFFIRSGETATIMLMVSNADASTAFFYPQLSDAGFFRKKQENYYLVMGIILGIMLITFLLNIFFAVSLKLKMHYLYAVYVLALLYEIFNLEGITSDYIMGGTELGDMITHISPTLCVLLLTKVMQWFLQQKRRNSYFKLPLDLVSCLLILNAFAYLLNLLFRFNTTVTNILQIVLALSIGLQLLLVFASAVEKTIQRYTLAWVYLVATIWLFVGLFEYLLCFLGINDIMLIKNRYPNNLQIGLILEAVVVFIAIIYRYNLYKKGEEKLLIELADQQRGLMERIVAAEEEERKRIAEDLHDDVGATLTMLNLHISNMEVGWDNNPAIKKYHDRGLILSKKAANDVRSIAHNLLPKDFKEVGLFTVLENRVQELNLLTNIRFSLITEGDETKLNAVFPIIIYRVINELLTNIVKHSVASEAAIQMLIEDDFVQIMTEDNGIGFKKDKAVDGIGLRNIEGRIEFLKGTLHIDSGPHGTHTIIHLPS